MIAIKFLQDKKDLKLASHLFNSHTLTSQKVVEGFLVFRKFFASRFIMRRLTRSMSMFDFYFLR
jgi:hypothetical protein